MNNRCLLLLLVALMATSTVRVLCQDSCEPDCFQKPAGELVEDPMNCTKFYISIGHDLCTDVSVPCEPGNIFDPGTKGCVAGTTCTPSCQPIACHLTCNGTLDTIADVKNCSLYYFCPVSGGMPIGPISCPADRPVFDGQNCITDKSKCCEDFCVPFCHPGLIQVPDPKDCTKFYVCVEEGPVDENLHFSCDSGQHFDVTEGHCVSGGTCEALCASDTPITTTTTLVTPPSGCQNTFTCTTSGRFPQCATCQPGYFECTAPGQSGILHTCSGNLVFNLDPSYPYCVLPTNCPFSPLV
ncbi:uncharacterized protein [Panulirus ornatus]|uniref:uncharacterized protein n=1 Tax=Panulirus ornatus TaxID=150431 RepID=UPI003A866E47